MFGRVGENLAAASVGKKPTGYTEKGKTQNLAASGNLGKSYLAAMPNFSS